MCAACQYVTRSKRYLLFASLDKARMYAYGPCWNSPVKGARPQVAIGETVEIQPRAPCIRVARIFALLLGYLLDKIEMLPKENLPIIQAARPCGTPHFAARGTLHPDI